MLPCNNGRYLDSNMSAADQVVLKGHQHVYLQTEQPVGELECLARSEGVVQGEVAVVAIFVGETSVGTCRERGSRASS